MSFSHAIDLKQAQAQLAELIDHATQGEEVILTDAGEPVAKIIPFSRPKAMRQFGSAKGLIRRMDDDFDAPIEDFRDYM